MKGLCPIPPPTIYNPSCTAVLRASSIVLGFTYRNRDGILKTLNIIVNLVIKNSNGSQNNFTYNKRRKITKFMRLIYSLNTCSNRNPHN